MSLLSPGDIISHRTMCSVENLSLQKGMNYGTNGRTSIILMSQRKGAPYHDQIKESGTVLIYEGHDVRSDQAADPKQVDQPMRTRIGKHTDNGKFYEAAMRHQAGEPAELVKVYEKIKDGIWVYNGVFELIDAWTEESGGRQVFKFKLHITDAEVATKSNDQFQDLDHTRMIPSSVKLEVWKRDDGKCVTCGSADNLHFDHILPFSKGGTSLLAENIQLLCARHNLSKSAKIQ